MAHLRWDLNDGSNSPASLSARLLALPTPLCRYLSYCMAHHRDVPTSPSPSRDTAKRPLTSSPPSSTSSKRPPRKLARLNPHQIQRSGRNGVIIQSFPNGNLQLSQISCSTCLLLVERGQMFIRWGCGMGRRWMSMELVPWRLWNDENERFEGFGSMRVQYAPHMSSTIQVGWDHRVC